MPRERCCIDEDRDGYGQEEPGGHGLRDVCWGYDCNDTDPAINPGVPERCGDSVDDNCNFWLEPFPWCCIDADRDGYGVGPVCWGLDCNDADPDVNPGVWERCGNNVDDNCDGQIDEGC